MTIFQGVDASAFQGSIDWNRVRSFNIDFAMLRATSGWGKLEKQTDSHFHRNVHDAAEAGIQLGAYHSSIAANADEAHREAECFLQAIRGYQLEYPVALDIEDRAMHYLKAEKLDGVVRAWCSDLRDAGYYPMICAQLHSVNNRLSPQTLEEFDLWLLRHGELTGYDGDVGIWQYTASGGVGGVRGKIGLDSALRDYPAIMRERGLNGFSAARDVKEKEDVKETKDADSLFSSTSPIMQAFNTLTGLSALNDILKTLVDNDDIAEIFSQIKTVEPKHKDTPAQEGAVENTPDIEPAQPVEESDIISEPEIMDEGDNTNTQTLLNNERLEDIEMADDIDHRHESRMLRGRWSWLFKN